MTRKRKTLRGDYEVRQTIAARWLSDAHKAAAASMVAASKGDCSKAIQKLTLSTYYNGRADGEVNGYSENGYDKPTRDAQRAIARVCKIKR